MGSIDGANIITSSNGIATVTFPIGNTSRLFQQEWQKLSDGKRMPNIAKG